LRPALLGGLCQRVDLIIIIKKAFAEHVESEDSEALVAVGSD